ncbi:hypothetical protein [Kitasatospora sp. NPDC059571]|uniref:hypothetical protein n=1 Tax=Kitasatospora sp. NPDC059571 TaxID=3346871 RepID=UPI0036B3E6A5
MPRSVFLGRPLPGPGEPLWTEDDRSWALALLLVEAEVCRGCGHPLDESTDPEQEFGWAAEVIRCHACATAARTAQAFEKGGGDPHGANVHVHRRKGDRS